MSLIKTIKIVSAGLLLSLTGTLCSQAQTDTLTCFIETGFTVSSGGIAPFWMRSNNYGAVPLHTPGAVLRASLNGEMKPRSNIGICYGIDLIERYSNKNEVLLQQAYAGFSYRDLSLKAGLWEQQYGNQYQSLSSGGLIWSGNARPIPELSLEVTEYISVPFTKKFVEFKGGISHGWFGDDITVDDILLHHKYLYVRFGGELPVKLHYGLHHFAQWSGYSSNPDYGQLPGGFSTFLRVFMARGGSPGAFWTEYRNATGNHIGSHNLGIDAKLRNHEINFYWQTIFEDGSGLRLRNIRDGLWGLKLSLKTFAPVSAVLVEYINTTDQSGTFDQYYENDTMKFAGGNDNYFNSGVYEGGWTYRGKTIGTPLITSPEIMSSSAFPYLLNNKISALHLGLEGKAGRIDYKAFYTFSRNYGTNSSPFLERRDQHSVLLKGSVSDVLPWNLSVSAAVAFDIGELYEKNLGVMFSMKKEGLLKSSKLSK